MQDIIDECSISRGGIYIYFASVDEIFLEVMKQRTKEDIQRPDAFEDMLASYLARQKMRLLNFENSLFRAYCEYVFSKPKAAVEAFRDIQLGHLRKSISTILLRGVSRRVIRDEGLEQLTNHFIVVIDGLSVLALAQALTEEIIDGQFAILNELINKIKINA
ncbi:MAG: TetR/AcrR family transcriptional regulator [Defluviitaleaceae bacterium]|nr:TetR/AcrR family transcriptional regulator [Defluviitaleaceae bacterium]